MQAYANKQQYANQSKQCNIPVGILLLNCEGVSPRRDLASWQNNILNVLQSIPSDFEFSRVKTSSRNGWNSPVNINNLLCRESNSNILICTHKAISLCWLLEHSGLTGQLSVPPIDSVFLQGWKNVSVQLSTWYVQLTCLQSYDEYGMYIQYYTMFLPCFFQSCICR